MYSALFLAVAIAIACTDFAESSNILAIFPVPFRDHQVVFRPLIETLLRRGHNLTVVTTDPNQFDNSQENIEIIDLSFAASLEVLNLLKNRDNSLSGSEMLRTVSHVMRTVAEAELESEAMQALLSNGYRFDAVLVDWSGPTLMNAFAYKFNAPLIGITPGGAYMTSHEAIGNPTHPVAFPSILMPFSEDLSLMQRVASTIFSLKYRYIYFTEELPEQQKIAQKHFGSQIPSLWEIESNAALLLVNCYQALGNARPVGPTTIYLGGIHASALQDNAWPLEDFLDRSGEVAYINLGGDVTQFFIDTHRMSKLLRVLENSSFNVVVNLNGHQEVRMNTTAKLYQGSDMAQESVLAHKNVKLFITIGGQREIEDAIHYKVPILGITFSSSLEHYLLQIVKNEAGLVANLDLETSAELLTKIETFAVSERHQRNIENLHRILTDQPQTSMERGIWWIEYVLRNSGANHIKSSWNTLSWLQYLLIDVFIVMATITVAVVVVLAMVLIRLRRYSKSLPFEKVTRRTKAKML